MDLIILGGLMAALTGLGGDCSSSNSDDDSDDGESNAMALNAVEQSEAAQTRY